MQKFKSVEDLVNRLRPVEPVYCIRKNTINLASKYFQKKFPGKILYALKTNPNLTVLKTIVDTTKTITNASILLNNSSSISTAILAPIIAPINAEIDSQDEYLKSEIPLLLYPEIEKIFCIKIATLFVPFAIFDGKPIKIRIGRVKRDPPPAIVLIKPAIIPHKNSIIISFNANSILKHIQFIFW